MDEQVELATVELLGALTYGQLRAFETTARAVRVAPDARTMDRVADHAVREHAAYQLLRDHLIELTDLGAAVMDRQKPLFDAFFDGVPLDDWHAAATFFAVGLPMAADFVRGIAPALAPDTALVVVGALVDRGDFEQFARDQVLELIGDEADRDRTKGLVGELMGRALTGFQGALSATDALEVLLSERGDVSGDLVKQLAMTVIENHRRRMHALGLEDLD